MIALWYLLGFLCGALFFWTLSLIRAAKRREVPPNGDDALKNILNY